MRESESERLVNVLEVDSIPPHPRHRCCICIPTLCVTLNLFQISIFREQKKEKEEQGYTKIKITIEKDRSALEKKQRKLEYWRNFEMTRESQNQQKKHDRIEARKEKNSHYPQLKEENARQIPSVSL